jgi:diacylglycerol kinase (ATP)
MLVLAELLWDRHARGLFLTHWRGYPTPGMDAAVTRSVARKTSPSVALLANLESGFGDAEGVAGLLRGAGATVTELPLDHADTVPGVDADRIVVAGGDGSLGGAAALASRADVPLAVIPTGTANDFAGTLGLPRETEEAVRLAVEGQKARRLDLAWISVDDQSARPFVNVASTGLSPVAAHQAGRLKRQLGPLAYSVGALRAGLGANPLPCEVTCDHRRAFTGSAWQVTVACTGAFGAGAEVDADPHDGLLDAVVMEAGSRLRLIRYAYGMRAGNVEAQQGVARCAGERVRVETDGATGFNVDGELVAGASARCEVTRRAFAVITG